MKNLQRLCLATLFTAVFTSATLAGEINTPGIAQPTPTPTPASSSAVAAGEILIGESTSEVDGYKSTLLTDLALDLLQIMLSVF